MLEKEQKAFMLMSLALMAKNIQLPKVLTLRRSMQWK